ncbi:MAG: HD domain-containing protein [Gammaproteobacteria bacterium]|nr:HD domain-containing protein [Gammaproteobacteria bacterium]
MPEQLSYHIIKDPVHGTMQFSAVENNWIKPFIDSPNFQRLRHIKQLGLGDYLFPGAVHTRFNHCIGCSFVAGQIAHKIGLAEEERQLVMVACLLHDIGHGPFSHTFEDIFQQKLIRHEVWTSSFLADFRTENFFQNYNQLNPRYPLTEEKFRLIENMIMHKAPLNRVLADIVSSQLDADRLDYLLRDSLFCGVNYGDYDLDWMLNSMVIVNSPEGERLGLTYKGIGVVEHYLMARRLMVRNIYFHPKKLAFEFFLVKLLVDLAENLETIPAFGAIKQTRLGHFLLFANQFNRDLKTTTDKTELKRRFIETYYMLYKELCDYDIFMAIKLLSQMDLSNAAVQIAKRLQCRVMPKIIRLHQENINYVESLLLALKKKYKNDIEDWQISLIRTPHQSYTAEEDPILIKDENHSIKTLSDISFIIQAMEDKLEHSAFLNIDKEVYEHSITKALLREITIV